MHDTGYKSALARQACRYSDARPPRKTDGILLESESPPHMRGKAAVHQFVSSIHRITPAYAGKRMFRKVMQMIQEDHPRVCGEKWTVAEGLVYDMGSPPHMRGKGYRCLHPVP